MAGIGFALRSHLRKETYVEMLGAYVVAGVIGSGPWLVSIGSMLFIGVLSRATRGDEQVATQFLATVTHLMAASLIVSGAFQLVFVRFIADRIFEKDDRAVTPNLLGALLLMTLAAGLLGVFGASTFATDYPLRVILVLAFATLCDVWLLSVLLSGLKAYRSVLFVFGIGYGVCVVLSLILASYGLRGYVASFFAAHAVMLVTMLVLVMKRYPSDRPMAFDFLDRKRIFPDLALTGFFFNIAVWVDKFVFWENPVTSERLIGPIRYSVVYDVPVSIAYLSVVPGMAVFFVRIETDFAEAYERFFGAIREGKPLGQLRRLRNELIASARAGIYDIFCIQGLAAAALLLAAPRVLTLFRIPTFYSYLFKIDVIAVGFQVVVLGLCTIMFYLDYRRLVLGLCGFFAATNLALSVASQWLGPRFYGFGFAAAAGITSLIGVAMLSTKLDRLEYETFMR
ncbi:MAG TPA: exopolysaccharide Pel transporter PelG [Polyangiaceae bacterium]|nr:exopolysaccharide Pel transporter PelG [Polyangiaceae bacterium]